MTTLHWNTSKHSRQFFIRIFKHQEGSWKQSAQQNIFDEIWGVSIANETLSWVFDISCQLKQKLRSKQRSKIVKIYANLTPGIQISWLWFSFFLPWWIVDEFEKWSSEPVDVNCCFLWSLLTWLRWW